VPTCYQTIVACIFAVVSGLTLVLLPEPSPPENISHYTIIGVLFGGIYGNTTSASIWSSLGDGRHLVRSVLATLWMSALIVGQVLLVLRFRYPGEGVIVLAAMIAVQSFLIQVPIWLLRVLYGLRLADPASESTASAERIQFGIAQMMIFTAIVSVLLGFGRGLLPLLGPISYVPPGVFLLLSVAAVLVTLPIVVATLVERRQPLAIRVAVVFVASTTAAECLLAFTMGPGRAGPDVFHVLGINVVSSLVVLAHAAALRWGGIRLVWGAVAK
jgi:hypothetical protein